MNAIKKELVHLCMDHPQGIPIHRIHILYQHIYGKPLAIKKSNLETFLRSVPQLRFSSSGELTVWHLTSPVSPASSTSSLSASGGSDPSATMNHTISKGTTWMQEVAPLIQSGGDPTSVETVPNWDRVPWLEEHRANLLNLDERPSPRIFATHFHYNMMPPSFFKDKPKVIYVMRNPRDVFTSSFHYYGMASYLVNPGTQTEFLHKFLDGKVMFGSWFDHVKGWLNAKDQERIMFISYEEMIMDLKDSVTRMSKFMGKSLTSEVIEKIADRCVFKNMKQNKMSNYSLVPNEFMDQSKSEFLRKGISGDWKNQLTVAEAEYFDAVYKDKMKDVKYNFIWD